MSATTWYCGVQDVKLARDKALAGMLAYGFRVYRRGNGEAIYVTSSGEVGTLVLGGYKPSRGIWRWYVDMYDVRWPRKNELARPSKEKCEITVHVSELLTTAEWIPDFLRCRSVGDAPPARCVPMWFPAHWHGGRDWADWGYVWSEAAESAYSRVASNP